MSEIQMLLELLEKGISPAHVVQSSIEQLEQEGFKKLDYGKSWNLEMGQKYYINHYDTTLFAFVLPKNWGTPEPAIRIAAAHTDFPCLRVKPACDITKNGYAQINIEVYGGAILNTWLDRPLGIAGRVAVCSGDIFHPQICYFSSKKNITIPNLAIHMNREINKGIELNKQTELLPIVGLLENEQTGQYFMEFIAKELEIDRQDILDYDLTIFCNEKPEFIGLKDEFISSPRLDNVNSCAALLHAIKNSQRDDGMNLIALFDHEEIGSRSKQGAASVLLHDMIYRILKETGKGDVDAAIYNSMILSVDVAHALHPNYMGKMDLTNQPILGKGLCIKEACSQSYATDCQAISIVEQICRTKGIAYQKFVNRSDVIGGGTLGSITSAFLPVKTVDIGIPLLAMHSARELMAVDDQKNMADFVTEYFTI